jgi:biotin synthase-like enzyme
MSAAPDDKSLAAPVHRNGNVSAGARHDWRLAEVEALFDLPFMDLMFRAQQVHRAFHAPNRVQMSTLLSIKTGGCPEDCGYCPQSIHFETGVAREEMLPLEAVVEAARKAQAAGATRFCMGAAFRSPKKKDIERIAGMIREVGALGLETCATLGMLTPRTSTGRSSPRAPTSIASTRWKPCATPTSRCAVAASWAWARRVPIARACS